MDIQIFKIECPPFYIYIRALIFKVPKTVKHAIFVLFLLYKILNYYKLLLCGACRAVLILAHLTHNFSQYFTISFGYKNINAIGAMHIARIVINFGNSHRCILIVTAQFLPSLGNKVGKFIVLDALLAGDFDLLNGLAECVPQSTLAPAAHARLLGLALHDVFAAQVELVLGQRDGQLEQQLLVQRLEVIVGHAVGVDNFLKHLVHVGHALLSAKLGEKLVQTAAAAAAAHQEAAALGDGDFCEDVTGRIHAHPATARSRFVVVNRSGSWRRLLFVRVFA